MDYKKLKEAAERDPESLVLMTTKLIEEMEQTCGACNEDRIACSFSPKCNDRWWIDILIEAGVSKSELPQFCYQRRRKEIERFLKQKETLVDVEDARYYLEDFLLLIKEKKGKVPDLQEEKQKVIDMIVKYLREFWSNVEKIEKDAKVFFFLNHFEVILELDFTRKIIKINRKRGRFKNKETLVFLLQKWSEILNLSTKTFLSPRSLYLKIDLVDVPPKKRSALLEEVKSIGVPFSRVFNSTLVIGLSSSPKNPTLKFEDVQSILSTLTRILQDKRG